jgi:1-acyl-sn-glycerol-3-phosphate acyltransferase
MPDKPRTERIRPELTRLPELTWLRRLARRLLCSLARLLVSLLTHCEVRGLEFFPSRGPALIVTNHLGDADVVLSMALFPVPIDSLGKSELYDFPLLGMLIEAYGAILVHRGLPDRRALREAIRGLREGRILGVAPEGRESLTGSLEEGTGGAAYLAIKADVPVVPVTFTGTENWRVYGNLKRFRRTQVSMTIGTPFRLEKHPDWRESVRLGTQTIMSRLAQQLPTEYRGVYRNGLES